MGGSERVIWRRGVLAVTFSNRVSPFSMAAPSLSRGGRGLGEMKARQLLHIFAGARPSWRGMEGMGGGGRLGEAGGGRVGLTTRQRALLGRVVAL